MIEVGIGRALRRQLLRIVGEASVGHRRRVHYGDDAIDRELRAHLRPVEGFEQRLRQSEAGGLDHDMVEPVGALQQLLDRGQEIVGDRAADAAVGEFDYVVLLARLDAAGFEDIAIHPDVAEFVDDERDPPPAGVLQEMPDHRRLAGAEEAGDDGGGDFLKRGHAGSIGGRRATTPFFRDVGRSFQGIRPCGAAPNWRAAAMISCGSVSAAKSP